MRAIVVHGGAGEILTDREAAHRAGVGKALAVGRDLLVHGGSAVDGVVAAVAALENNPEFNAGYGAVLNEDGYVELDAGLMDGTTLDVGAVAVVNNVANPIQVCRYLLPLPSILFAKEDVIPWAIFGGIPLVDPGSLVAPRQYRQWADGFKKVEAGILENVDTVGAVALDERGGMAAATSTGGICRKPPGRIGDSPLPGCGYYADSAWGACSATGWGESIARIVLSRRAIENLERGESVSEAAIHAVQALDRIPGGRGGLILLDRNGRFACAKNTKCLTRAWWREDGAQGVTI